MVRIREFQFVPIAMAAILLLCLALHAKETLAQPGDASKAAAKDTENNLENGKVLVVLLHAQHCRTWCKEVRPILEEIKKDYGDRLAIRELDITEDTLAKAKAQAKQLGVASFIPAGMDSVPCVGIFSADRHLVGELAGPQKKSTYKKYIEKAMKAK